MIPSYSIKGRTSCRRGQIDCYSRDAVLRRRSWSTTAPDIQRRSVLNGTWQVCELVKYVEDLEGIAHMSLSERYFSSKYLWGISDMASTAQIELHISSYCLRTRDKAEKS